MLPAFEYLEVRPCIETKGNVVSYRDEQEFLSEITRLSDLRRKRGGAFKSYWTIYGMAGAEAVAIGDFSTKAAAHEVMDSILAPMAHARDVLDAGSAPYKDQKELAARVDKAASHLEDFILQSSNLERI